MSKLTIMIDLGAPKELTRPHEDECKPRPIEDEIRESLELIDSGHESNIEWRAIKGLYSQLTQMKQTSRVKNLRDMIRPVLSKYGFHVE